MSWPWNRAPLDGWDGYGWRSQQRQKRDQDQVGSGTAQVRPGRQDAQCFCVRLSPPSAVDSSHDAQRQVQTGRRADIVSDITPCFPSLHFVFPFPIKIHRDLASSRISSLVSPGFPRFGCLFLFSPFPSLLCAFPWLSHLVTPSFQTSPVALRLTSTGVTHCRCLGTCHILRFGLDGLVQPTCFSLAHTPLNKYIIESAALDCGAVLWPDPLTRPRRAVSINRQALAGAFLEHNDITSTASYPA